MLYTAYVFSNILIMAKRSRTLLWVLGLAAVLILWGLSSYNGLVTAREGVNTAWADVQTQEQRRFDLVPNLVATVKAAANFEQGTLTAVTEARTRWQNAGTRADQVAAAQNFESALSRLLVTVEAYPELTATQGFRDLQTQLEGTENRIATQRRDYNLAVQSYNIRVRRVPGSIIASVFGFEPEAQFIAVEGADVPPTVQF